MSSRNGLGGGGLLPKRRNGKQSACEPCRKSKIACDHTTPVCDRCKRRKVADKCVYVDAPMTRPAAQRLPAARGKEAALNPLPSPVTGSVVSLSPVVTPSISSPDYPEATADSGPWSKSGVYFGPTNFSAVFLENKESLGNGDEPISSSERPDLLHNTIQSQEKILKLPMLAETEYKGSPRVAAGVKLLQSLPDKKTFDFLLEWYSEKGHECSYHKPSVVDTARSVWATFGKQLKEPRRLEDLEDISMLLCKNNETALPEHDDYGPWLASFTGMNMRWEAIGCVFAAFTSATLSMQERDAFFCCQRPGRSNRKQFALELKDCVQGCITLSNYQELINLQMVSLLVKNLILQTIISGDTSLLVWRQMGDLVSTSTAMGLHREASENRPLSFLSNLKRQIFTVIFNIDKGSSLLTGRPPALSYRFTHFKLPLDLTDEVLMRGGDELKDAAARLDDNGWRTDGTISAASVTRSHGYLAIVLNEILEVSLGNPAECTNERISYLINRLDETCATFPEVLLWTPADATSRTLPDEVFWRRIIIRLQRLEQRLLLERLAYKQKLYDGQSMVDCAREMLELTVLLWVQRDRFPESHHDYDWMLMCWGVPSSGVLCVELLKQIKQAPGTIHFPMLPRSEIVQNLSLLIGFLEWVSPAAGNYQLCTRMRQIVKRILDQILNPPLPATQESIREVPLENFDPNAMEALEASVFEPANYDEGLENLDWLDSVDWSRGPWIDLGGQDYSAARWG